MKLFYTVLFIVLNQFCFSQTNPTRFALSGGNYTFTNWAASSAVGTYPTNMVFQFSNDPTGGSYSPTAIGTSDYNCGYNVGSRNRFNGLGANGFSFLATSDAQYDNCNSGSAANTRFVGNALLGLNSTGVTGVTIAWTGRSISAANDNRVFIIKLQYRVGNTGAFTNVNASQYTAAAVGNSANFTQTLPATCDNQANLYVRWVYYQTSGSNGTRPELAVDDITVSTGGTGGGGAGVLTFDFSPATTKRLAPPVVTGTINDAADPARFTGIITTVKDNDADIAATDYIITASSSNTAVVSNANVVVTKNNGTALVKIIPSAVGYSNITLTLTKGTATKTLVINYAASQANNTTIRWPSIIADASAIIPINDSFMIVANDESNALYVYNRYESGLPYAIYDYNQGNVLELIDGAPAYKEVDVEAAVRSKTNTNRIYWLGSMSNSVNFNDKPNRNKLFAVTTTGTAAATTFADAGHYNNLRARLIAWGDANGYNFSASAADGKDSKLIDGFNVEGMVFAPNNTTLYIAFRAPLVPTANRTKAVIAPITNFETFFNNGAPSGNPTIGAPIELNLDGNGIRDIIRQTNGSYILIAGNYDNTPIKTSLYRWSGIAGEQPVALNLFDLGSFNAEGIMEIVENGVASTTKYQIITDNGTTDYYNDGIEAKDLAEMNFKKFSIQTFESNGVLPIGFSFIKTTVQGKNGIVSWGFEQPENVVNYTVSFSVDGITFKTIGTQISTAFNKNYSFTVNNYASTAGFYRVSASLKNGSTIISPSRFMGINGIADEYAVYPNPITNSSAIYTNKIGVKQVAIYNMKGEQIQRFSFAGSNYLLPTKSVVAGQYVIKIMDDNGVVKSMVVMVK